MDDRDLLKKDLIFILGVSEKYDLRKDDYVRKLNILLKTRSDLNTTLGRKYRERLQAIEEGKNVDKCFICDKNPAADRVICDSCMEKYSFGKKRIYSENKPAADDGSKTDSKNSVQEALDKVEKGKEKAIQGIKTLSEKGKAFADDNDLKGKAVEAGAKAKRGAKEMSRFWNKLSKRNRAILVAALVIVIVILGLAGAGKGRGSVEDGPVRNGETYVTSTGLELSYYENPSGKVDSDEAAKVLSTMYPQTEGFSVEYVGDGRTLQYWFWGPIGRTTELTNIVIGGLNDQNLTKMAYKVEDVYNFVIKSDRYYGNAIVNTDGRIVAQGTLPGFPDYTNIYRIR